MPVRIFCIISDSTTETQVSARLVAPPVVAPLPALPAVVDNNPVGHILQQFLLAQRTTHQLAQLRHTLKQALKPSSLECSLAWLPPLEVWLLVQRLVMA